LPGYFETLRSRILEGRTFTEADNASGQKLAVIDQSLAEKVFPNQSALERRICVYIPDPTWLRVIGVVEHQRLHTLADRGREQIDRKSTRLNSSHQIISYAVFCL